MGLGLPKLTHAPWIGVCGQGVYAHMGAECMCGLNNPFTASGTDNVHRRFSLGPPSLLLRKEASWKKCCCFAAGPYNRLVLISCPTLVDTEIAIGQCPEPTEDVELSWSPILNTCEWKENIHLLQLDKNSSSTRHRRPRIVGYRHIINMWICDKTSISFMQ